MKTRASSLAVAVSSIESQESIRLSIVIVTHHSMDIFVPCFLSVLSALPKKAELILIVNGLQPEKQKWLSQLKDRRLKILCIEKKLPSSARNLAWNESKGDIFYFLDDDVEVPPRLFELVLETFNRDPDLGILGGPNLTPPASSFLQKLFGEALAERFVAPRIFQRYRPHEFKESMEADEHQLILCNMAIRPSRLPPFLRFSNIFPNEENVFIRRARDSGAKVCFRSDLFVYHHRPKSLVGFSKQIARYGSGRVTQTVELRRIDWIFFAPLAFLIAILYSLALGHLKFMGLCLSAYFLVGTLETVRTRAIKRIGARALLLPLMAAVVHFSYALGTLSRILDLCFTPTQWTPESRVPNSLAADSSHIFGI